VQKKKEAECVEVEVEVDVDVEGYHMWTRQSARFHQASKHKKKSYRQGVDLDFPCHS